MTIRLLKAAAFGAAATLLVGTSAFAQGSLSEGDRKFVDTAAESGHAEISAGHEAMESKNNAIAVFGTQMIAEHTKMNDELAAIAKRKGYTPPASPDLVSRAEGAALSVLPGSTFDKTYVSRQISAHQSTLQALQTQAESGQDPELKEFARKYIPTVEKHIAELEDLQKRPDLS